MSNKSQPIALEEYNNARKNFKKKRSITNMQHIDWCATAAKTILKYEEQIHFKQGNSKAFTKRLSKYDKDNNLRLVFNKNGVVSIYSNFPKGSGIENKKLGHPPQLHIVDALKIISSMSEGLYISGTLRNVFDAYDKNISTRHDKHALRERTVGTYHSRTKTLRRFFDLNAPIINITAGSLEHVLDDIIEECSNNHAIELFAEMKRVWKFAKNKFNGGKNPAQDIDERYVSDRVITPTPCEVYTDLDSICELWINLATAPSIHQKNTIRLMILTGLRPINIAKLKWEWIDNFDFPTTITFPSSAMKNKKPYKLALTKGMRTILQEQKSWALEAFSGSVGEYIFLQPSNPHKHFAVRSLDKIIKDYSPVNCVQGDLENAVMKGTAGAFCTMCRSFTKSNVINLLINKKHISKQEAERQSRLVLHHIRKSDDPNAKNYNKSEELFGTDTRIIRESLKLHEVKILSRVKSLKNKQLRQTGLEAKKEARLAENKERNELRTLILKTVGKSSYSNFINSHLPDHSDSIKQLILEKDARPLIYDYIESYPLNKVA